MSVKLVTMRKVQRSTRSTLVQNGKGSEARSQKLPEGGGKKRNTSTKEWKWQRGIVAHPLSESQWNRGYFSMKKLESEKHKNWGLPAEGFKGHVATDGSSLGRAGKWGACGWAVCSWIMMRRWCPYMGCMARWKQNLRSSQPSKGRS